MTILQAHEIFRKALDAGRLTASELLARQMAGMRALPPVTTEREFLQRISQVEIEIAKTL